MLIGSGLLAKAFAEEFSARHDVCIYAAGVSNSSCVDPREFYREQQRLGEALARHASVPRFVYFGTCSVADSEVAELPYVRHKLEMERLVREHRGHLILRLPQVAGVTPNPHTLLNFLYARISRSEGFKLWRNAKRNIIDVVDVSSIACRLIADDKAVLGVYNIANPVNNAMSQIVDTMQRVVGKKAIYEVLDRGSDYPIDIGATWPSIRAAGVTFGDDYLQNLIGKYYPKEFAEPG